MYKKILAIMILLLCNVSPVIADTESRIEAFKVPFHVGETVMACGTLAEIKHLSNRHYLKLDKKYPNQTLTLLVWDNDYRWFEQRFGNIDKLVGRRFCARGKIEEYKNNMQIKVTNPQFLRLMNR